MPKAVFEAYSALERCLERGGYVKEAADDVAEPAALRPLAPWLISVSAGADSAVLWHVIELWLARHAPKHSVAIIHVQYPFRKAAEYEASQLESRAHRMGRPFHRFCPGADTMPKSNHEAWARETRIAFYAQARQDAYADSPVFVARHGDDNFENLMMRCARQNTWWTWLTTQPAEVPFVSPFEAMSRAEILAAAAHLPHPIFEDHTNTSMAYRRNCMRHLLIPFMNRAAGAQFGDFRALWPIQKKLDEQMIKDCRAEGDALMGAGWLNRSAFEYAAWRRANPNCMVIGLWLWLSRACGPRGINARRFAQLIDTLLGPNKQFPKYFDFPETGIATLQKNEISLSQASHTHATIKVQTDEAII